MTFPFTGVLFCVHIIIIIVVFQTCRIIKTQVTLKGGVTKKCAASRSDQSFYLVSTHYYGARGKKSE